MNGRAAPRLDVWPVWMREMREMSALAVVGNERIVSDRAAGVMSE